MPNSSTVYALRSDISEVQARAAFRDLITEGNRWILDKPKEIQSCITCLLASGHVLIEDLPGMGKTTLGKLLAELLGLDFQRIQFTSDLLPTDILGTSIWNEAQSTFEFHRGPIFGHVILGDELNRATPRAQSALLQALEERQISVDGVTHPLPQPFFFIGTQNPRLQAGTYALPESQMDRFMMRLKLGFPSRQSEMQLVQNPRTRERAPALVDAATVRAAQGYVSQMHLSEPIAHMIADLLEMSRTQPGMFGLSTRAGIQLGMAARAWAWIEGRSFVLPEDFRAVATAVVNHRILDHAVGVEHACERSEEMILALPIR